MKQCMKIDFIYINILYTELLTCETFHQKNNNFSVVVKGAAMFKVT